MPVADSVQYRYSLQNSTVHTSRRLSTVQVFFTGQYSTGIQYRTVQYMPVGDSAQNMYLLQNSTVHASRRLSTQVFITELQYRAVGIMIGIK